MRVLDQGRIWIDTQVAFQRAKFQESRMGRPAWIEKVNLLDTTRRPIDIYTYATNIGKISDMYPDNFSKSLHDSHKFASANLNQPHIYINSSLSPQNREFYPGTGAPAFPEETGPINIVPVYSRECAEEFSGDFGKQEDCNSPDNGNQDSYSSIKNTEGQYNDSYNNIYNQNIFEAYSPEHGEIIANASPDYSHINALFTQTSPIVDISSYNRQISKINVLTPNELSIKAANELAALEMNDGLTNTEEGTNGMLTIGGTNSNNERQRKDEAKLFHLRHIDGASKSTIPPKDFERNNNILQNSKQSLSEAGWQVEHLKDLCQWEQGVKEEPSLNYDQFEESTPRYWPPQSKIELPAELKNLSTLVQSKYAMEEFVSAPVNQPIVNNITLQYGPTYTIVQTPSENTFSCHQLEVEHSRHVYQQQTSIQHGRDGQQYNIGEFVDVNNRIGEDPLQSYHQKNDYLVNTKMTEKPPLSAWQRKQAKSAGVCVVCSDKSSGWHYNVQVTWSKISSRGKI